MIRITVAMTPPLLSHPDVGELPGAHVVIFDVLRATTTMSVAIATGVREIRAFAHWSIAQRAAGQFDGPKFQSGEEGGLAPQGFDLGNSPRQFDPARHAGRVMFHATTNGTGALFAGRGSANRWIGSLANATATARALRSAVGNDGRVILLAAGLNGGIALEDVIGCGAVADALIELADAQLANDSAAAARALFLAARDQLEPTLRDAAGGRNLIQIGLDADIEYCARLDTLDVAVRVDESASDDTCVVLRRG